MRGSICVVLLAACATTPRPQPSGGPRGLHASEHLDVARDYDDQAREITQRPDDPSRGGVRWVRSWDAGEEYERLASIHRSKAGQLDAAYHEACGDRPIEEIAVSPLQRFGHGGSNTPTGVILYLDAKAGGPDQLRAELECHRAWMMLAPAGMETCPLDLPGLVIQANGDLDGITLSLGVRDPKLVPELQRRAAQDLEASMHVHGELR